MSKPYPIIYLPKRSDHEVLIKGIYDIGYSYAGRNRVYGIETWLESMGPDIDKVIYPWVTLKDNQRVTGYIRRSHAPITSTPVNSIRHFLRYAQSIKDHA